MMKRLVACVAASLLLASGLSGVAAAGPALVVDDASGQVIYSEEPDQTWFPASLTKLMTIYVAFSEVKAGRLSMDTKVPLSDKARGQPATRIGLRLGIELSVEQAIRGLILRSANDFSMALAELIGQSEEGFAVKMNAAARKLGMTRSRFTNPHGLPDPEQVSTARDMALLGRAIYREFPQWTEMFSTPSFIIHRGTFHSQNDLLRTLEGADGMKTGFTCGAGYNIVASATREGRRIIAVVLGEATREERSVRTAALIEHGFAVAEWKQVLGAPRLERLAMAPAQLQPVHDMSKETRTRQCGNLRRLRRIAVGKARPGDVPAAAAVKAPAAAPVPDKGQGAGG
jgi:D-alanyl-D-alanine carboxypeptidase